MPSNVSGPVPTTERILALDVLRGWAVFGMLVVNLDYFARLGLDPSTGPSEVAAAVIQILAASKFWTLFSVLFGLGFAMQLDRATARGERFGPLWARRLLILLVIGLAHALLHPLEILHRYAVLGFLLLPLRRASTRLLVVIGLIGLLVPPLAQGVAGMTLPPPPVTAELARQRQADAAGMYSEGSLPELMVYNVGRFRREAFDIRVLAPLPYFLLGFHLGRRRFLETLAGHLPLIRRARWYLLGLGLTIQAAVLSVLLLAGAVVPVVARPLLPVLLDVGSAMLGLFYACVILLLTQRPSWRRRLHGLAAVGRLALTNYLLQTVLATTLLYGYGSGLYGRIGPIEEMPIALVIFTLQVVLSRWWIRRFRFGPVEWLWRSGTYGRPQPLRVAG